MTKELNLVAAVEDSFRQFVGTGKIEAMIETQLETLVKKLITDMLSSYSEFGKSIDTKLRKALATGDFTLPQYGERVCKLIETITESMIDSTFQQSLKKRLHDLLIGAPETIPLSKLCEQFAKDLEQERYGQRWSLHFERTFPDSELLKDRFTLSFDSEEDVKARSCEFQVQLCRTHSVDDVEAYELESVTFNHNSTHKQLFCEPSRYGFAAVLWQMYAAKTVVAFDTDPDDIDTSIGSD